MLQDFAATLTRELVYEGGKVDDPHDPGGRTNRGITQGTYNAYRRELHIPSKDVFLISDAEVATIYKTRYWDVICGDKLPKGLDIITMDGAVNSGNAQSIKWVQASLGASYKGAIDGQMGLKTLQAIEDCDDVEELIHEALSRRLATLKRLKTWSRFGKGWSARIANVQKTGLAWAAEADAPHPVSVDHLGGHQKAIVTDVRQPLITQGAAHVITGAASTSAMASGAADQLQPVQAVLPDLKYLTWACGGLLLVGVLAGFIAKSVGDAKAAAEKATATAQVDPDADAHGVVVPVNDNAPPAAALALQTEAA